MQTAHHVGGRRTGYSAGTIGSELPSDAVDEPVGSFTRPLTYERSESKFRRFDDPPETRPTGSVHHSSVLIFVDPRLSARRIMSSRVSRCGMTRPRRIILKLFSWMPRRGATSVAGSGSRTWSAHSSV